jgi:hypothetical protein
MVKVLVKPGAPTHPSSVAVSSCTSLWEVVIASQTGGPLCQQAHNHRRTCTVACSLPDVQLLWGGVPMFRPPKVVC